MVAIETVGFNVTELSAYCRERGLYLSRWSVLAANCSYLGQRPSVPEALDANARLMLTMAEEKELEKLRAQEQRKIKALRKVYNGRKRPWRKWRLCWCCKKKWDAFCSEDE